MVWFCLSLLLTVCAFWFESLSWIIFFSMIPLMYLLNKLDSIQKIGISFLFGFLLNIFCLYWLKSVSIWAVISLSCYNALYYALFGFCCQFIKSPFLKACAFTLSETIKYKFLFGSPFVTLANVLGSYPFLIQLSNIGGIMLVSFWIISVNIFVLELMQNKIKQHQILLIVALLILPIFHGWFSLHMKTDKELRILELGVVQPNISRHQQWKFKYEKQQYELIEDLTKPLLKQQPDLIIWPESSIITDFRINYLGTKLLYNVFEDSDVPLLFGSMDDSNPPLSYNALFYLGPPQEKYKHKKSKDPYALDLIDVYHKVNLVPFGEFTPFEKNIPWLKSISPVEDDFDFGDEFKIFTIDDSIRFAPLICFEDLLGAYVRSHARDHDLHFLLSVSNDNWFLGNNGALFHDRIARFRSVENALPLIRCSNVGVSSAIDQNGRLIDYIEKGGQKVNVEGSKIFELKIYSGQKTLYQIIGEWWLIVLIAVFLIFKKDRFKR